MWKQDVGKSPTQPSPAATSPSGAGAEKHRTVAPSGYIGASVVLKGSLTATEDLTVAGRVEGTIELPDHILTVAPGGQIIAEVAGRVVQVAGTVVGNIVATDKIEVLETGSVEGDVKAPRIVIADGARFRGRLEMQTSKVATKPQIDEAKRSSVA